MKVTALPALLVVAVLSFFPSGSVSSAAAPTFHNLPFKSIQPVQYLNDDNILSNSCTAFSINQEQGFWVTAAHCVHEGTLVEGAPVIFLLVNPEVDVALFSGRHAPYIRLANGPGDVGDEVVGLGYPLGSIDPLAFFGRISGVRSRLTTDLRATVFDMVMLAGDSGGPILNKDGKVVGIMQNSNKTGVGWSATGGWWEIKAALGAFWED